jgi:hypothetical protein
LCSAQIKVLTVFSNGDIRLSSPTVVSVGRAHAGTQVTVLLDGDHVTIYSPEATLSVISTSTGDKPDNNSAQPPSVSHNYLAPVFQ